MDASKISEVVDLYREEFRKLGVKPIPFPHEKLIPVFNRRRRALNHCSQMLDKMEEFVQEGRLEKTFRWLGFLQGALWVLRIYTLEELKNHNRPAE